MAVPGLNHHDVETSFPPLTPTRSLSITQADSSDTGCYVDYVTLLVIYMANLFVHLVRRYLHWIGEGRLSTSNFWFSLDSDASNMFGILLSNAALNSDGSRWLPQDFAWVFTLLCGLQAFTTLLLHCAELCINSWRDETAWRQASLRRGLQRNSNALVMFLTSWQSMTLFLLKPFAHWVYSLNLKINIYTGITILPAQVC